MSAKRIALGRHWTISQPTVMFGMLIFNDIQGPLEEGYL
tara:strand:+ start:186 stop:302 length:117 start_codon:yes stop_codon:yes gene_type:complete